MTNEKALLQAILDNPADDATRLIYADWLNDQGQAGRAEFIRVQVKLAVGGQGTDWCHHDLTFQADCRGCTFRRREEELLGPYSAKQRFGQNEAIWFGNTFLQFCLEKVAWIRGFVAVVSCSLDDWEKYGPALVRRHPIEEVRLTDEFLDFPAGNPDNAMHGPVPIEYADCPNTREGMCRAWLDHAVMLTDPRRYFERLARKGRTGDDFNHDTQNPPVPQREPVHGPDSIWDEELGEGIIQG